MRFRRKSATPAVPPAAPPPAEGASDADGGILTGEGARIFVPGVDEHVDDHLIMTTRVMAPTGAAVGAGSDLRMSLQQQDHADIGTAPAKPDDDRPLPLWRQMLRVYVANRLAVLSTIVLILIIGGCFLGPHFYHTNQTNANTLIGSPENLPPNGKHLLGTDDFGWDELGRVLFAGQYSLTLGLFAGLITIFIGTAYGMVSGYVGGILDGTMMRLLDAFLSIPYLFLLISLIAIFGRSTTFLILLIGLTGWWGNARIIRGDALVIRDLEYSQAATSMGAGPLHIIRRHVFPNSVSNIVTVGTFSVADAILFLSALGFLGLGIQAPATDWGTMLTNGAYQLQNGYWWEVYPVTIIFITVIVCINYMGDALRDIFEVRLRER